MRKVGRPKDKTLYINSLVGSLGCSYDDDTELKATLGKLNSKDLLLLKTYICKSNNKPLNFVLQDIPEETPAQSKRYNKIVNLYHQLKIEGNKNEFTSYERATL